MANEVACDKIVKNIVSGALVVSLEEKSLDAGPIAQASILQTPSKNVFILAGGLQERWALLSMTTAPAAPCSLAVLDKCILVTNPLSNAGETVKWIGCDGDCKRWFHVPCLHLSNEDYFHAVRLKKWFCNRSDCK